MATNKIKTDIYIQSEEVVLKITDDYNWGDNDRSHLADIIKILKTHLGKFISGEIYDDYPNAKGKNRIVEIVGKHAQNDETRKIFSLLEKSHSFSIRFTQQQK